MNETLEYVGWLKIGSWGECDDALWLSDDDEESLAERLADDIEGKNVSVRYWISPKELPQEDMKIEWLKTLMGDVEVDVGHHYSEITGYLWTDEEVKIGGHDLIGELKSYDGKYLLLQVDMHSE